MWCRRKNLKLHPAWEEISKYEQVRNREALGKKKETMEAAAKGSR